MNGIDPLAGGLGFVLAAYLVAALLAGLLIAWIVLDYRNVSRDLKELERRGIGRRT